MISLIIAHTGSRLCSAPDVEILLTLLADIKYLWYEIGLALRIHKADLEHLKQGQQSDIIKLSGILNCWISQLTTDVTWNSIISAVKGKIVKQPRVAEEIEKYVSNANPSGETATKRMVTLDASTFSSSKKYSKVPVEPQRSQYSMLLK